MNNPVEFAPRLLELLAATPEGMSATDLGRALRKGAATPLEAARFPQIDVKVALLHLENESKLESEMVLEPKRCRIYFLPGKGPSPARRIVPAASTTIALLRPHSWLSALGADL